MNSNYDNVTVEIVEQPQSKSMRFRYQCEGRTAGSILGVNSTEELKTFPAIRVLNYDGSGVVLVSCVTEDTPHKPHPNCLIGRTCARGVCRFEFATKAAAPTLLRFQHLGIQCAKVNEAVKHLEEREQLRIDPFKTGFTHKLRPKLINFHKIRLCFQVLLTPDYTKPKNLIPLKPVVSDVICDKHRTNMKLAISETSDNSSPPGGDKKIMIFCDKVDKRDIRIRFHEEDAFGNVVWEDWAQFQPSNVHKQVGIAFRTPPYKVRDIAKPVNVFFRLQTVSGDTISNSIPFQYVPDANNMELAMNSKKRKIDDSGPLYNYLEDHEVENRQSTKMKYNIKPNIVASDENVAPAIQNFVASNFDTSQNNLQSTVTSQHYGLNTPSLLEQDFETQKSEYQWPLCQPLQPQKMYNVQDHHHQKCFDNPQFEQPSHSYQHQMNSNYGNHSMPYNPLGHHSEAIGNVYGATNNLGSNNFGNHFRNRSPLDNNRSQWDNNRNQ